MLKLPSPDRRRQNAGTIAGFALAMIVTGSVYAASTSADHPAPAAPGREYQLDMQVELATDDGHKRHAETVAMALCTAPGKTAEASVGAVTVQATPTAVDGGQVRIELAVTGGGTSPLPRSEVHGALGQVLHAAGNGADGRHAYAIDVTPQAGCPARTMAEASPVKVTERVTNGMARAVAVSIAAKAGWTLDNPDALGDGRVTLSFNDMPAGTALQRVADLAGMKLALSGSQVHFEPK